MGNWKKFMCKKLAPPFLIATNLAIPQSRQHWRAKPTAKVQQPFSGTLERSHISCSPRAWSEENSFTRELARERARAKRTRKKTTSKIPIGYWTIFVVVLLCILASGTRCSSTKGHIRNKIRPGGKRLAFPRHVGEA